jgi:hypothetical protein
MTSRAHHQPLFLLATALLVACGEPPELSPAAFDEPAEIDHVAVTDTDNASLRIGLAIETQQLAAQTDDILDWSALSTSLWSSLEPQTTVDDSASLRHFPSMSLEDLTQGIADNSISQTDLGLDVSCSSEGLSCPLSKFSFDEGHAIDVVSLFTEGEGSWLVTIRKAGSTEAMAYLALEPSTHTGNTLATVTDDSSQGEIYGELSAQGPLQVPADGDGLLDWSALTRTTRDQTLHLHKLDRLELSFVPGVQADSSIADLDDLWAQASETWFADIAGSTSFPLPELRDSVSGEPGFPGFEDAGTDAGRWVLSLWATSTGDPAPAFLALLDPATTLD